MDRNKLFEAPSLGNHYTWSNKHVNGVIYSRIDGLIGNVELFVQFHQVQVHVLHPGVLDHSPLLLADATPFVVPRGQSFKFLNYIVKEGSFLEVANDSWYLPIAGTAMYCLWQKLRRLQPSLRKLNKKYSVKIFEAQTRLMRYRKN